MSVSDLKAEALTAVRNAMRAGKESVDIKKSKLILEIIKIIKREKFIRDFREISSGKHNFIRVYLKYDANNNCVMRGIKLISKPGLRIYAKQSRIPKVLSGQGIAILSTSKGIFTDNEARKSNVGGEVVCYIW